MDSHAQRTWDGSKLPDIWDGVRASVQVTAIAAGCMGTRVFNKRTRKQPKTERTIH